MINDLKTMYGDEAKVKIIGETIKSMSECMEKSMCLEEKDDKEQDPTVQLWLYYFQSQHALRLGKYDEAMIWINKGIEHTPTVVELYLVKAKIFQHSGNRV